MVTLTCGDTDLSGGIRSMVRHMSSQAMMAFWTVLAIVVTLAVLMNMVTAKRHARFGKADVEGALETLLSPESRDLDKWDLFLSRPIDDPYYEAIRQRCLDIVDVHHGTGPNEYLDNEGISAVAALLSEVRRKSDTSVPTSR
jgi:hypothetical protein